MPDVRENETSVAAGEAIAAPLDFQAHLANLERAGLLVRIDTPIDKDSELHPLVRWQFIGGVPEAERKAFLFTNVVDATGRRYDMPVAVGGLSASAEIYAKGMGRSVEDIGKAWLDAISNPIPPVRVNEGRCQEVVLTGEALTKPDGGLATLPVPISTPGFDCAPYLTATLCVTKDPDSGIQNMGTYRACLRASDRLAMMIGSTGGGQGGFRHWQKYRARGEPMPIAIVIGAAPVVVFTGPQKLDVDMDELGVAGALAGQPIRIVRARTVDLDVPADAEVVIEGLVDTTRQEPEGPFGESHGHIALETFNLPIKVTAVTHKKKAVFTSILSQVTPSESSAIKKVAYEPLFLSYIRNTLGVRTLQRVVMHEPLVNLRPVIFLQFSRDANNSEIWRALNGAANLERQCGKIVIAVSTDVDPSNLDGVFWSMAYRCNMLEDIHILPHRIAGRMGQGKQDASLLIDATQKRPLPPLALPTKEYMERARGIWEKLGLHPLTVRPPWHGYDLGAWTEDWERYAQAAAVGRWQENGKETLARQRDGIRPQTPVSAVEGGPKLPDISE